MFRGLNADNRSAAVLDGLPRQGTTAAVRAAAGKAAGKTAAVKSLLHLRPRHSLRPGAIHGGPVLATPGRKNKIVQRRLLHYAVVCNCSRLELVTRHRTAKAPALVISRGHIV